MLGLWGAGKTSLVSRFVNQVFSEDYHATLGVKMDTKELIIDSKPIKLVLWDLAGSEGDFALPKHFLNGSAGYILVLDSTRVESLETAIDIISDMRETIGEIPFILALNKTDLPTKLTLEEVESSLNQAVGQPLEIFPTSAKTGSNVEKMFEKLGQRLLEI